MQLGLVGLGKMGFNMRERLRRGGHEVIGYDPRPEVSDVESLAALAAALPAPRVVWVMVPSGPITDDTIRESVNRIIDLQSVADAAHKSWKEADGAVKQSKKAAKALGVANAPTGDSRGVEKFFDGKVFDQSEQTAMPVDGVVPGFSEGLQLMKRGGEYQFFIPPALAYGDKESGPIPANSVLIFNVKLIDFKSRAEIMAMQQQMHQMQGEGMHP
mgnify:CR=1 FL=1